MPLTLSEAGKATGRNRTTILRAIKAGKLSAAHDEATGAWLVESAELFRVYPAGPDAHASAPSPTAHLRNGGDASEIRELRARLGAAEQQEIALMRAHMAEKDLRLAEKDARIAELQADKEDLRRRLDQATALLTDQRPAPTSATAPPQTLWRKFLAWRR